MRKLSFIFLMIVFSFKVFANSNMDLITAISQRNFIQATKALDNGANPNFVYEGVSMLTWSVQYSYMNLNIAKELIERGADPSLVQNTRVNLSFEQILLSLSGIADLEKDGVSLLVGRLGLLKELVKYANLEATDEYGNTALVKAVKGGRLEIVKILINAGARTDVLSSDGKTLIELTGDKKIGPYKEIRDFLLYK